MKHADEVLRFPTVFFSFFLVTFFYGMVNTYTIVLNDRNNDSESIHTLIDELAHAAMHQPKKMAQKETALQETPVLEYQAEMTAYVVAHAFGLDTKAHSLHYTAQ
ncbi:ImmA/IrrE family metallo-endopeptidase [Aerococcus viridans]